MPRSPWDVVLEYANSDEGRRLYPKLRTALSAVDNLVGMVNVKTELAYTVQTLLSYKKLEKPQRTMQTRCGQKRSVEEAEDDDEEEDEDADDKEQHPRSKRKRTNSDMSETVRLEVAKTLARLLSAARDDTDDDDEEYETDEEEYDEVDVPEALAGEKMHCLIMGPSGCGKTTLATALANVWHAMGLVSGKFTAVGKGDVASKWQGESLMRINELIDEHQDGVLFIDEAYGLRHVPKAPQTYGNEVLTAVVQKMTDPRCTCTFILAGYEGAMKSDLLEANEGLERRFATVFVIKALDRNQLAAVFRRHLKPKWRCAVSTEAIAQLLQSKPGLVRYGGADMVALVRACERAHITRFFPKRISRYISHDDFVEGIRLFSSSKARRHSAIVPSGMYC